jgi:phosphoenolpyruvate synthase/pyruvate phosphate dikinase
MTKKWVYLFNEVHLAEKHVNDDWEAVRGLLGGKGANLTEMVRIGVPVPPGFTVTTEACNAYRRLIQMFGNMEDNSATGVAMTRNGSTGEEMIEGDYLTYAQGEDVVAGVCTPSSVSKRFMWPGNWGNTSPPA